MKIRGPNINILLNLFELYMAQYFPMIKSYLDYSCTKLDMESVFVISPRFSASQCQQIRVNPIWQQMFHQLPYV